MIEINALEFEDKIESGNSVIMFKASWCSSCAALGKLFETIKDESINLYYIDIETNYTVVEDYNIINVPTVIGFKDGNEKFRFHGNKTKSEVLKYFSELK